MQLSTSGTERHLTNFEGGLHAQKSLCPRLCDNCIRASATGRLAFEPPFLAVCGYVWHRLLRAQATVHRDKIPPGCEIAASFRLCRELGTSLSLAASV